VVVVNALWKCLRLEHGNKVVIRYIQQLSYGATINARPTDSMAFTKRRIMGLARSSIGYPFSPKHTYYM